MVETENNSTLSKLLQNPDLFGDDSESEEERSHPPPPPPAQGKRRKPTGAATKAPRKSEKPAKLKKSELGLMYSEGQRLIRESAVRLPEYQPKTKSLDGFLTKLRSRQTTVGSAVPPSRVSQPTAATSCLPTPPHSLEITTSQSNIENEPLTEQTQPSPSPPPSNSPADTHTGEGIDEEATDARRLTAEDNSAPTSTVERVGVKNGEHVENDREELSQERENGESVTPGVFQTLDKQQTTDSGAVLDMKENKVDSQPRSKVAHPPKQTSITSLFAKQETRRSTLPSQPPSTVDPPERPPVKTRLPLVPSSLPPAPKLSSVDEFVVVEEERIEPRNHTPVEKFQLRLIEQITGAARKAGKNGDNRGQGERGEEEEGEGVREEKPLISDDVMSKLKDRPGAIREVWRNELRRQMSQRLAEERKAAEETKKFYNEDLPDEGVAEEEAEFTDPDTSDHEFIQNEAEEEGDSDACSDLDDDEGVGKRGCVEHSGECGEGVGWEEEGEGSEGKKVEEEEEGYSGGDESESDECFSDNENIHLTNRSSKNKQRLLDSDDEGESRGNSPPKKKVLASRRPRVPSCGMEEASMGPLALFEEDSNENADELVEEQQTEVSVNEDMEYLERNSGVVNGGKEEEEGERRAEEKLGEELKPREEVEEEDVVPTPAVPDSDKDNSLESSLLYAPSLPAAQPWNDNTATCGSEPQGGEVGVSQWAGFSQRQTQNTSLDEETQFLDANGLLKQKKARPQSSAVSLLADTSGCLDNSTSVDSEELLALCSGRFVTQPGTQGFATQPGTQGVSGGGLSKLLHSTSVVPHPLSDRSTLDSTDMSEVLGLCSGAFPTTQQNRRERSMPSEPFTKFGTDVRGCGDGSASSESGEEGEGEGGEVLSWAQRQRKLTSMLALAGENADEEDAMPRLTRKRKRGRPKPKATKGERLAEFVESEAELSGEDVGSDMEEEEGGGVSEYEDEGDQSDVPLSESELWNQVNKAHIKETMADDRADLNDLKERFLQEGDLYEDGLALRNGFFRSRRFNAQSEGSLDLFSDERREESGGEEGEGEGEGEVEVEDTQMEALRRKDRLEREEFMRKCRDKESSDLLDEDSQSILNIIRDTASTLSTNNSRSELPASSGGGATSNSTRLGSFLRHNSATLRRLSSLTSATPNVSSGKTFVFQKASTDSTPFSSNHDNLPAKKVVSSFKPPQKKARIVRTQTVPSNSSVFNLF